MTAESDGWLLPTTDYRILTSGYRLWNTNRTKYEKVRTISVRKMKTERTISGRNMKTERTISGRNMKTGRTISGRNMKTVRTISGQNMKTVRSLSVRKKIRKQEERFQYEI